MWFKSISFTLMLDWTDWFLVEFSVNETGCVYVIWVIDCSFKKIDDMLMVNNKISISIKIDSNIIHIINICIQIGDCFAGCWFGVIANYLYKISLYRFDKI